MRGHEQILALREQGFEPTAIFIEDRKPPKLVNWEIDAGALPAVYVGDDNPKLTDLRFVVGCRIHLVADDPNRADAWVQLLRECGAQMVIHSNKDGEIDVWQA